MLTIFQPLWLSTFPLISVLFFVSLLESLFLFWFCSLLLVRSVLIILSGSCVPWYWYVVLDKSLKWSQCARYLTCPFTVKPHQPNNNLEKHKKIMLKVVEKFYYNCFHSIQGSASPVWFQIYSHWFQICATATA